MQHRILGRTGLSVSEIGLGTEHLVKPPKETVVSIVREAVGRGVTYFDIIFSFDGYIGALGDGFRGHRDRLVLAAHLGSAEENGQYRKTRDVAECRRVFENTLRGLGTDHIDVLFLSNVDEPADYETIIHHGVLELANELIAEGKARFLALSGHEAPTARRAVTDGHVDVLMYPVNMVWDSEEGRSEAFHECVAYKVGLVGMKPFGGGELFNMGEAGEGLTPVRCLAYSLSQPGVSTVVPGVKSLEELHAVLAYLDSTPDALDFSCPASRFRRDKAGLCMYCNHCHPCPAGIDVAAVMKLLTAARRNPAPALRVAYADLAVRGSSCLACGDCVPRCPAGVDVPAAMAEAVRIFGD